MKISEIGRTVRSITNLDISHNIETCIRDIQVMSCRCEIRAEMLYLTNPKWSMI